MSCMYVLYVCLVTHFFICLAGISCVFGTYVLEHNFTYVLHVCHVLTCEYLLYVSLVGYIMYYSLNTSCMYLLYVSLVVHLVNV